MGDSAFRFFVIELARIFQYFGRNSSLIRSNSYCSIFIKFTRIKLFLPNLEFCFPLPSFLCILLFLTKFLSFFIFIRSHREHPSRKIEKFLSFFRTLIHFTQTIIYSNYKNFELQKFHKISNILLLAVIATKKTANDIKIFHRKKKKYQQQTICASMVCDHLQLAAAIRAAILRSIKPPARVRVPSFFFLEPRATALYYALINAKYARYLAHNRDGSDPRLITQTPN